MNDAEIANTGDAPLMVTPLSYESAALDGSWQYLVRAVGWLHLVLGAASAIFSLLSRQFGFRFVPLPYISRTWPIFVFGIGAGIVELIGGVGLIRLRAWGRVITLIFAFYAIALAVISPLVSLLSLASARGALSSLQWILFLAVQLGSATQWLAFPALSIVLMYRQPVRKLLHRR